MGQCQPLAFYEDVVIVSTLVSNLVCALDILRGWICLNIPEGSLGVNPQPLELRGLLRLVRGSTRLTSDVLDGLIFSLFYYFGSHCVGLVDRLDLFSFFFFWGSEYMAELDLGS